MKRLIGCVLAGAVAAVVLTSEGQSTTRPGIIMDRHSTVPARWALDEVVPDINVDNISISQVMDFLRNSSGANLVVDWSVLETAGVSKESPVTLQVRGLPLRKVLLLALDQASPTVPLSISVDQNVIEVTTQEASDRRLVTRTYSVADLLVPAPTINTPTLSLQQATQQGSNGGGGGSGLFNDSGYGSQQQQATATQVADQLIAVIKSMVRPTIWQDNGGTASISYFQGQLIVTAPLSVHQAIAGSPESSGERYGF
ncbi:MAG: hypothetical protein ACTHN5_05505 [Phycisphaerae bacterium]